MSARRAPPRAPRGRLFLAVAAVALVAFAIGVVCAANRGPDERATVERYARAWERQDWRTLHAQLDEGTRDRRQAAALGRRYRAALDTATATAVDTGRPRDEGDGRWRLPATVTTRAFGPVTGELRLRLSDEDGEARIAWRPELVFPGLGAGERLRRTVRMPDRADLLARDGSPLAVGADRQSPLGAAAQAIVGAVGPVPQERRAETGRLGYPADAQVGLTGLERIFDRRLAGTPGGELRAGLRLLARREPRQAPAVRTTIAPKVQQAAVTALAGRLGGVVALRPRTGEVLAAAGIGFSGLQPPGSTFKMITLTGALESGIAKPSDRFPVRTAATLSGVELQNANGESCGGTLVESFAESCNSVFAPLGAKLGARRLVATAARFGFDRPPGIPGAATSTIPPASEIGDDLAVGSSAIGQGRVQATALQMAWVAATIGLRGRRPSLTLDPEARSSKPGPRATSAKVARQIERMMRAVVNGGTGTRAAIAGAKVAGKTGTAELRTTTPCKPDPENPESCPPEAQPDPTDTDAWFAAYAPAGRGRPRIAVGVMLVGQGAGGDTAAPAARTVLLAAL